MTEEAKYHTIPALSPYTSTARYGQPKEIFKAVAAKLHELTTPGRSYRLADIGCANGEFLHYLAGQFPGWQLSGYDSESAFIEVASAAHPEIDYRVSDLFEIAGEFDIVTTLGTFAIFADPEPLLAKLTTLAPLLLIDGYFNLHDVDVRLAYRDNSKPESAGIWRSDFHQHAQSTIRALLEPLHDVHFEPIVMGVDIPQHQDAPHANAWTFKDEQGCRHITSGLNMLLDDTLLVVTRR